MDSRRAGEASVFGDGQRFVIPGEAVRGVLDQFQHVRIQYRTPQQLKVLERFHSTLKSEEVY
jgi:hypothetical protein